MTAQRVVMVVDMQNGVFATPRLARERCVAQINRLVRAADKVIFIQHDEAGGLEAGSEGFALLPELEQPAGALYVTKTACDAFYHLAGAGAGRTRHSAVRHLRLRHRLLPRYHH